MSPKCSRAILSYMPICNLLWLPVVYYGYTYSLPLVLPCIHYNNSVLFSLYYLLSLPILLSALLTYSCIPTQFAYPVVCSAYLQLYSLPGLYMTIRFAMPMQPSELPITFYALMVSISNIRLILSNRTYSTKSYQAYASCNKIR